MNQAVLVDGFASLQRVELAVAVAVDVRDLHGGCRNSRSRLICRGGFTRVLRGDLGIHLLRVVLILIRHYSLHGLWVEILLQKILGGARKLDDGLGVVHLGQNQRLCVSRCHEQQQEVTAVLGHR